MFVYICISFREWKVPQITLRAAPFGIAHKPKQILWCFNNPAEGTHATFSSKNYFCSHHFHTLCVVDFRKTNRGIFMHRLTTEILCLLGIVVTVQQRNWLSASFFFVNPDLASSNTQCVGWALWIFFNLFCKTIPQWSMSKRIRCISSINSSRLKKQTPNKSLN